MPAKHANIDKLLGIGAAPSGGPKHARDNRDGAAFARTGQGLWFFWVAVGALPLFVVPAFRLLTGVSDLPAALALAFGNLGMLYIGITMAITSLSDIVKAGLGEAAHWYFMVSMLALVLGLFAYSLIAIAPEVGRDVSSNVKLAVNLGYVGVELALGCIGYGLIGRG